MNLRHWLVKATALFHGHPHCAICHELIEEGYRFHFRMDGGESVHDDCEVSRARS